MIYKSKPLSLPNAYSSIPSRVGATSLFLATKVEENCRKMKELVIACCRVAQKDPHKLIDEQDKEYWRWRDVILLSEDVMLEAICFDLSLEPPYKTLFEHLIFFREGDNNKLRNAAWAFVNDSYLTMLCLMFPSRTIATSALYAAAKHCGVTFPDDEQGRPWWDVLGVDVEEIRRACNYMAGVYENVPSKSGKEGGMYERILETEDDANDRTRAARSTEVYLQSPEEGRVNGVDVSPPVSETGEAGHAKRAHEERFDTGSNPVANGASHGMNGDSSQHDDNGDRRKRPRIDINGPQIKNTSPGPGQTGPATRLNGTTSHKAERSDGGGLVSPNLDDVSEEGEVEA